MSRALNKDDGTSRTRETASGGEEHGSDAAWLDLVAEKVKTLHYGVVQIVVHDSRVVQVERTERHRFDVPHRGG